MEHFAQKMTYRGSAAYAADLYFKPDTPIIQEMSILSSTKWDFL